MPFRTIRDSSTATLVVQKSRFIGQCFHVASEEEAQSVIESVRKQYWDARHCCYAYILSGEVPKEKSSDDGEPSGTAGAPILYTLKQSGLQDVLCTVTRYFGGILLGKGGLTRAYSQSAADAVRLAEVFDVRSSYVCETDVSYSQWAKLEGYLRSECVKVLPSFSDIVSVRFSVDTGKKDRLFEKLGLMTDASVCPAVISEEVYFERALEKAEGSSEK